MSDIEPIVGTAEWDEWRRNRDTERAVRFARRRERQFRLIFVIALVAVAIGLVFVVLRETMFGFVTGIPYQEVRNIVGYGEVYRGILTFGGTLLVVSLSVLMFLYLQTGFVFKSDAITSSQVSPQRIPDAIQSRPIEELFESLAAPLREEIQKIRTDASTGISPEDRAVLIEQMKAAAVKDAAHSFVQEVEAKLQNASQATSSEREFEDRINQTRARLLAEIAALQLRGNLNLSIGAAITGGALYILWTTVSWSSGLSHEIDWTKNFWPLVVHFAPRVTLAIFLEIFAYFFLKLYRSSLSEIKYFQNELTNVEAKQLALNAAARAKDSDGLKQVIASLLATERNHILNKDQTTVELEKVRLDKDQKSEIVRYVTELFSKKG